MLTTGKYGNLIQNVKSENEINRMHIMQLQRDNWYNRSELNQFQNNKNVWTQNHQATFSENILIS